MSDMPATKKQTWALFCLTKKDYRNQGLTMDQASQMIKDAIAAKGTTVSHARKETNDAVNIHNTAVMAGRSALNKTTPTPMVVEQHSDMLNDNSPVVNRWVVEGGCCGFASIHFKATTPQNRLFVKGLKKAGLLGDRKPWQKDSYRGGYYFWVSDGGQSLAYKEAYAYAFNQVLTKNGIDAYVSSRMD